MFRRSLPWGVVKLKLPGRKALDDICKLELLRATPSAAIMNLWMDHHKQYTMYWGRVISVAAYNAMRPRLDTCRYFVVPLFREKGLFNVVTNFSDDVVGVVPLAEFQKKGDHAIVHMTIQFFTELAQDKQLVLVRCEIQDKVLQRQDCLFVTQMLLKYYTLPHLYEKYVETFNKRPNQFDYHEFLRHMKDEAQKDTIDILDKKSEVRGESFTTENILRSKGLTGGSDSLLSTTTTKDGIKLPSAAMSAAIIKGAAAAPSDK